ncbi:4-alpha-glucanotransferase [Nocardioides ferulae]|uniref:4-alpha-glucanotransferase n=1 Tax=Nocardioides ferulae TaxID=2340821 RepID=UPI00197D301E|nr:4-alpha-glucanotransferase [Nocardioides ferulae]
MNHMHGGADVDDWGIQRSYWDTTGQLRHAPDEVLDRMREVIGRPPEGFFERTPIVTRPGRWLGLGEVEVTLEDGEVRRVGDHLPDDFPLGYHRLRTADGVERRLIVSPGRCWLPERQSWGWTVQLYGARSRRSWGIGDLGDLRLIREWTERLGGGFVLVNPLHAATPLSPQEASPYLPATRRFRNPIYLRVEEVAGFSPDDLAGLESDIAALNAAPLVDRDAIWPLKRQVLRTAFARSHDDPAFATWRAGLGRMVEDYATWSALTDQHGPDWHDWPAELRRPDAPGIEDFRREHAEAVDFHAWMQWQLDVQLRAASGELTVLQDLPIGVAGGGADAWGWQDVLAQGVSVGAPPDALNANGQDWGSPPLVPWRMQAMDYEPFIESIRGTIAGAGGLRIDHVMGLFRLYWIVEGLGPREGVYVRYPADDLLDIVALESHRAQAVIVGEDLGTVEPGVREALAERGILSYKVLYFEDAEPQWWPQSAMATVTTHDLPTVAGLWTGSDAVDQLASTDLSHEQVYGGRDELLGRVRRQGLADGAGVQDAVDAAYRQLSQAPCLLLSLALEDAVLEERRPNVPGTVERENWRIPLPMPLEELVASEDSAHLARLVGGAVAERG